MSIKSGEIHLYHDEMCLRAQISGQAQSFLSGFKSFLFLWFTVAHPQEPHHSSEKPVIHCHKCGEPCKGEVLRVQARHFHIKCFTCKGKTLVFMLEMSRFVHMFLEAVPKGHASYHQLLTRVFSLFSICVSISGWGQ